VSQPQPTVIVNADDYGFTPAVSAGIRLAHRSGIVTSTSVLIVAPSARADLAEAKRSCPELGIGVHLTLTGGWRPILSAERVRSLITRRGRMLSSAELEQALIRATALEVAAEWRAQIEAVIAAGVDPDHLDAHHDVAYRSPPLTDVLLELASSYRLPIRLPIAPREGSGRLGGAAHERERLWDDDNLSALADMAAVPHPSALVTVRGGDSPTDLIALLESAQPGAVTELLCHPGNVDWRLRIKSSYTRPRERELALLTDERVTRWVRESNLNLTTFSALGPNGGEERSRVGR